MIGRLSFLPLPEFPDIRLFFRLFPVLGFLHAIPAGHGQVLFVCLQALLDAALTLRYIGAEFHNIIFAVLKGLLHASTGSVQLCLAAGFERGLVFLEASIDAAPAMLDSDAEFLYVSFTGVFNALWCGRVLRKKDGTEKKHSGSQRPEKADRFHVYAPVTNFWKDVLYRCNEIMSSHFSGFPGLS